MGNIHYGYVGSAAGFAEITLLALAGYAQARTGTYKPEWYGALFDDPQDQEMIKWGIKLYYENELYATYQTWK